MTRIRKLFILGLFLCGLLLIFGNILIFEQVSPISPTDLIFEGGLALMAFSIFVLIQKFEGPCFIYRSLSIGFMILFFSGLTDAMDDAIAQPKVLEILFEDVFMLVAMMVVSMGVFHWLRYNQKILAEVQLLATTDQLTGVYNRHKITEIFQQETARSERYETALSSVMMDIDFFKKINDTYGHQRGDDVLRSVATIAVETIRETDYFARVGGEEFVLLLPNTTLEQAVVCAEKVRAALESRHFEEIGALTASLGVSQWRVGDTIDSFSARADHALYAAKEAGRNRVAVEAE